MTYVVLERQIRPERSLFQSREHEIRISRVSAHFTQTYLICTKQNETAQRRARGSRTGLNLNSKAPLESPTVLYSWPKVWSLFGGFWIPALFNILISPRKVEITRNWSNCMKPRCLNMIFLTFYLFWISFRQLTKLPVLRCSNTTLMASGFNRSLLEAVWLFGRVWGRILRFFGEFRVV